MEFQTEAVKAMYEKLTGLMKEVFGEMYIPSDEHPAFWVKYGSAVLTIRVDPFGEDEALVFMRANMVKDVELGAELMEYLLKLNNNHYFGLFAVDTDGFICSDAALYGSDVSANQLREVAMAVLNLADKYDDEIIERWGGTRAME